MSSSIGVFKKADEMSHDSVRAKRGRTKRGRSRDPGIPGLEPQKVENTEKPEFRIWTPENRKRRKKRKKRKNRNSGSGPLKTGKGGKHGKDGKSGCPQNPGKREENELRNEVRNFGCNRNELRNKVRNCWHDGPETTENGKRNLKKGLCSRDTFGAATFGGLGMMSPCRMMSPGTDVELHEVTMSSMMYSTE